MRYCCAALLVLLLVAGCGRTAPLGSAQSIAASDQATANTLRRESVDAQVKAAQDKVIAAALEETAARTRTREDIEKAVSARVTAEESAAVAQALEKAADDAKADALAAATQAATERAAENAANELLWWTRITQIAGAVGIGAGILLGGIVGYVTHSPAKGIGLGCGIALAGFGVAAYGALEPWMILVLGFVIFGGLIAWLVAHVGDKHTIKHLGTKLENAISK